MFRTCRFLLLMTVAQESFSTNADEVRPPSVVKVYASPVSKSAQDRLGSQRRMMLTIRKFQPLHRELGPPQPGDWLAEHEETGQSFVQYVRSRPVTPTGRRRMIYVQPLGEFNVEQRQIIDTTAEYLSLFFSRPVNLLDDLPLTIIPDSARRTHPDWKVEQILSRYVLNEVLKPRLPDDAAALIAFTAVDLWPGEGWNFLFGQALLRERVGVWSMYRNGNPADGDEAYRQCLRRTLRTATHETGHMFSMLHCTAYECNMCGSNHLDESDRLPLYLCAECHAKICWATNSVPVARFERLQAFCREHQLAEESEYYRRAIESLSRSPLDDTRPR